MDRTDQELLRSIEQLRDTATRLNMQYLAMFYGKALIDIHLRIVLKHIEGMGAR